LDDLQAQGCLVAKAGSHGVCVFWHEGRAWALDDRCPHLGFPLHRGTVGDGLVTCHWHNARFDLATGGTLDPFADDARPYPVVIEDGDVFVVAEPEAGDRAPYFRSRLEEALEQGLTLVAAKAVLGLLEAGEAPAEIVRVGVRFGTANRDAGWGAGLTVLVAMANLLPHLDPADRPLALIHGLAFVSRDTRGRPPNFPLAPLQGGEPVGTERLAAWYRRFIETRSPAAAERALVTALAAGAGPEVVEPMVFAPVTDHLFLDDGHTADFTNKAFEALDHLGWEAAADVLPSLVPGTARARRHEEDGAWRHPHDLAALARRAEADLAGWLEEGRTQLGALGDAEVAALGHRLLADEPEEVIGALAGAVRAGATPEQLGRALALAGALRITRFHTANDFGDWDSAHHGFTHANALHQALRRHPTPELLRGVIAGGLRVFLDRFLNIPAARLPEAGGGCRHHGDTPNPGDLAELSECWDTQGGVDRAGGIAYRWLRSGGDPARLVAALGRALLSEDAGFHWFQTVEAAVRQFGAWPAGSEEGALILAGTARFLAAHTPTRRELPQVVRIATRLRRGEELYEAEAD
jgi:nitrite reductase/ring-hydroxylating ferredoxin subunit